MVTTLYSGILLDTSFLIQLTNSDAPEHMAAQTYFGLARSKKIGLYLSPLVLAEFEVKQCLSPEIRAALIPAIFDLLDGKHAAEFQKAINRDSEDQREMVRVDSMLMAQAHARQLVAILTNDKKTLAKHLERLRAQNLTHVHAIVLSDGFEEARLLNPAQQNLNLAGPQMTLHLK